MALTDGSPLRTTALAVLAAVVASAVLTVVIGVPLPFGGGMGHGGGRPMLPDLSMLLQVKAFLATFNALMLLVLTWSYLALYRDLPNPFTGSLLLFSVALLLYAVSSNPLLHVLFGFRGGLGLGPFTFLPDAFASVAVVTLLYQSYR